jgi:hypothetical protein
MFNYAMSIAAFGFVAFALVFVHPAPLAGGAAAHHISAGSEVAVAAIGDERHHLAASK